MPRFDPKYRNGVLRFIEFALEKTNTPGRLVCPCNKCYFQKTLPSSDVYNHLVLGKGGLCRVTQHSSCMENNC
jgi:hypothetical protein